MKIAVKLLLIAFIALAFSAGPLKGALANEAIITMDDTPLPDAGQPWKPLDLKEAGTLYLPGQPKILTQNKPEKEVTDFFRGLNMGRCLLLQAVYGGAPDRKPRAALMALSFRQFSEKQGEGEALIEKPITTSLEDSMGAFEDSFLPFMKRGDSQSFEMASKQIQETNGRKIFLAEYTYEVAAAPHKTRVALFKYQGRLYIFLLETLASDDEFWQVNFPEIIAKWVIPSRDGHMEPEKTKAEPIAIKPDTDNRLKPLLGDSAVNP